MSEYHKRLTKEEKAHICELFLDGFTVTELSLMYKISIFRIMVVLERFGIDL